MLQNLDEDMKRLLLAGIGAAAITAEKSKEVIDLLVKKGAVSVEQGKILNEELKHKVKEMCEKPQSVEQTAQQLKNYSKEELELLKQRIEEMQREEENGSE